MKNKRVTILQYVITFLVCALLSFLVISIRGIFSINDTKTILHYLVDAFFAVGILCAAFGLLVAVANWGAFDIIVYVRSSFARSKSGSTWMSLKNTAVKPSV